MGANSTESVRCSYYSNCNESDLRISGDNTCTDSLVTALDDEALLICDAGSEMARTKVFPKNKKKTVQTYKELQLFFIKYLMFNEYKKLI